MRTIMITAAVLSLSAAACSKRPGPDHNPLLDVKEGDWTDYVVSTDGGKTSSAARVAVVNRDSRTATVRVTVSSGGRKLDREMTVDLKEDYLPVAAINDADGTEAVLVERKRENVTAGGLTLPCVTYVYDLKDKENKGKVVATAKISTTRQVKFGVLLMEVIDRDSNAAAVTMTWVNEGRD